MDISLSPSAIKHIQKCLQKRGRGLGIRFGVKKTGCSGYAYVVEYVDEQQIDDLTMTIENIIVFVDTKSLPYLDSTKIDFVREGLSEGFKFDNPHAKSYCGCGESFNA